MSVFICLCLAMWGEVWGFDFGYRGAEVAFRSEKNWHSRSAPMSSHSCWSHFGVRNLAHSRHGDLTFLCLLFVAVCFLLL